MANYNCDTLGDHLLIDCNDFLEGGSDQVILLESGHGITDFTNGTQVNDAITAGTAHLFTNVLANLPIASEETRSSYKAGVPDIVSNYTRTLTWLDANVNAQNDDIYETLNNGWEAVGFIIKLAEEDYVWATDSQTIKFRAVPVSEEGDTAHYDVAATWKNKTNPKIYSAPSGVFS